MGKISNSINHYLSDNRRFADLFNGVCFQGKPLIRAEDLREDSLVYRGTVHKNGQHIERRERTRDICKMLKTGETLRVLAVESQQLVDYTMPFRCMQYDVMEYEKQLEEYKKKNRQRDTLENMAEKICGLKRDDRLYPVYTICLYHGVEAWDGPRSLGDMMDFRDGKDSFRTVFKDYPLHLYCLNEAPDLRIFHTEIGLLFQALQYRKDRTELKKLIGQDQRYQCIDADTLETMSVMLQLPSIWKERKKYMEKKEDDREGYNMCQAIKEWAEEERSIGRAEGQQAGENKKTYTIVRNMLLRGMADDDIMAIAECNLEIVEKARAEL